jgi:hypothetical protein
LGKSVYLIVALAITATFIYTVYSAKMGIPNYGVAMYSPQTYTTQFYVTTEGSTLLVTTTKTVANLSICPTTVYVTSGFSTTFTQTATTTSLITTTLTSPSTQTSTYTTTYTTTRTTTLTTTSTTTTTSSTGGGYGWTYNPYPPTVIDAPYDRPPVDPNFVGAPSDSIIPLSWLSVIVGTSSDNLLLIDNKWFLALLLAVACFCVGVSP